MYSHMHVIVMFTCLEDQDRHRDRMMVDVQITKWKYRRNQRIRILVGV